MKMWVKIAITAGSLAAAGAGGYFGWKFWGKKWWTGRKAAKEPLEVTRKAAAFFVVEGKPDTTFKWEVSEC